MNKLLANILSRLSTLGDRAGASDKVTMKTYKAHKVFCVHCREHIFYLKSKSGGACTSNLVPLGNSPLPTTMNCPLCGQDIRAWVGDEAVLKTDRGYL